MKSAGRERRATVDPALEQGWLCFESKSEARWVDDLVFHSGSCYAVLARIMEEEQRVVRKLAIIKRLERFRVDMSDADFTRLINHVAYVDEKTLGHGSFTAVAVLRSNNFPVETAVRFVLPQISTEMKK